MYMKQMMYMLDLSPKIYIFISLLSPYVLELEKDFELMCPGKSNLLLKDFPKLVTQLKSKDLIHKVDELESDDEDTGEYISSIWYKHNFVLSFVFA